MSGDDPNVPHLIRWLAGAKPDQFRVAPDGPPPPPTDGLIPQPGTPESRAYIEAVISGELAELARTPEGGRNHQLNHSAWTCARFIPTGHLAEQDVREFWINAGMSEGGQTRTEATRTVDSAIRDGKTKPREVVLRARDGEPGIEFPGLDEMAGERADWLAGGGNTPPPRPPPTGHVGGPDGGEEGEGADHYPEPDDESPEARQYASGHVRWAQRFVGAYQGRFLHAHGIGWHRYDAARWVELHDRTEIRAVMALVGDVVRDELPRLMGTGQAADRKRLLKEIEAAQSANAINGILTLSAAKRGISVAGENLDRDRWQVNTPTGTLDLRTGTLGTHRPDHLLTKITAAGFRPDARSDLFDDFLCQVQPDPAMRAFLARSLGAALLGLVRDHVLLMWYGTGANGKGTLRDAVRHALGSYAVEVPADILLVSKFGQQALAPERMRLRGTRLAFCSEIAQGARLDEATMKKLTGGDPVNAKLLYRNPVEFDPSHSLIMLTNHLPRVRGDDPATWRRIMAVPFEVVIPEAARDTALGEKLEDAADAVLAWLWGGWLAYQRDGLAPPEAVRAATARYQQDSDIVARFLAEDSDQVIVGMGTVRSSLLYGRFTGWCAAEGENVTLSNKAFTELLEIHGFKRKRTRAGAEWEGLTLTAEPDKSENHDWFN